MSSDTGVDDASIEQWRRATDAIARVKAELARAVFGQERVVEEVLISLLSGGHALIVGVPGLAKTLLVASLARALGLDHKRVQFTPDLMPSDILGAEILEERAEGGRAFRFVEGPVFTQLLMADEINRASPRTQAALLQAMQERKVTIAGEDRALPSPFHVLATQNPIEQEGAYPLPEAQLDRFLLEIRIDYPERDVERRVMIETTSGDPVALEPAMDAAGLAEAQAVVRKLPLPDSLAEAILDLVRRARPEESEDRKVREAVAWGPGPRASQALASAVRARALVKGASEPCLDDLRALAAPVLRHRIALQFSSRAEGLTVDDLIGELLDVRSGARAA